MGDTTNTESRDLQIAVAPLLNTSLEYFSALQIDLNVTNLLPGPVLIEDVSLCFQSDTGYDVYVDCQLGKRVEGNRLAVLSVEVKPTTRYRENTNFFHVLIHYRPENNLKERRKARQDDASFIVIRRPNKIGDTFISFQQPEDIGLARLLESYAQRAGLNPFLVTNEPEPGTEHWIRIEEAIERSRATFVIWGIRTEWAKGVEKEIELTRQHRVEEILLLDRRVSELPAIFKSDLEYQRFDHEHPGQGFARAIEATRKRFIGGAG